MARKKKAKPVDPIAERVARVKSRLYETAIGLLPDDAFLGSLAISIPQIIATGPFVPTAATDGVVVYWNDEFADSLSDTELRGVMVHELYHIALGHCILDRVDMPDPRIRNLALDVTVNGLVDEIAPRIGETDLPSGAYRRPDLYGREEREIYATLLREQISEDNFDRVVLEGEEGSGSVGDPASGDEDASDGAGAGGDTGEGEDAGAGGGDNDGKAGGERRGDGSGQSEDEAANDLRPGRYGYEDRYGRVVVPKARSVVERRSTVERAVADAVQAAGGEGAGNVPAGVIAAIEHIVRPPIDWRRWISLRAAEVAQPETTWRRLSPRTWGAGVAIPGMVPGPTPHIGVLVDASGSIGEADLGEFLGGIASLVATFPGTGLTVVSFDAEAYPVYDSASSPIDPASLVGSEALFRRHIAGNVRGGGGTFFEPAFRALLRTAEGGHVRRSPADYTAVVVLTDGYPMEDDWAVSVARRLGFRNVIFVVCGSRPSNIPDLPPRYAVAPLGGRWPGSRGRKAA